MRTFLLVPSETDGFDSASKRDDPTSFLTVICLFQGTVWFLHDEMFQRFQRTTKLMTSKQRGT